jgi:hypothetical protein
MNDNANKGNGSRKAKGGIIRPGQRKPFIKGTARQIQERVEFVAGLLVKEKTRTEIHRAVRRKFNIEYLQCDLTYVKRAKEWLVERCNITAAQAKSKGLNVLVDVLRTGTNGERLKAERRLAEVFGYDAPRRMEVTGRDGEPLLKERPFRNVPTEELIRLAESESREADAVAGNGGGNGRG